LLGDAEAQPLHTSVTDSGKFHLALVSFEPTAKEAGRGHWRHPRRVKVKSI
jgi:hypothetical protein